jgi:phosphoglycerol transferase MdoB-like AlkP superfamily enzyme
MSRLDYDREVASPERRASLFSIANGLGYRSCYFSPLTGVFADNRRTYGELFAPERMYFLEDWTRKYGLRRDVPWGLSDRELYSGVLKIMRAECGRRFVVLISTMDTHSPYTAIGISDADKKRFPTPFLQALHMTDRNLGEFLRELMADKTLYDDRTLIVITADHTATHGENYLHRKEYVPERVPLIFITPDRTAFDALDRKKYASGIDLAPTLVELIGGKSPDSFMGRSLFSDKGIAISWMPGDKILVRSPKGEFRVSPQGRSSDPEKQAVIDFFRSHY